MDQQPLSSPAYVLMSPLPTQGDLNPMLKIAELLCLANLKVTFLNTPYNHHSMTRHTDIEAHFSRYPYFRFETILGGLPDKQTQSSRNWLEELIQGLESKGTPLLRERLIESAHSSRVTCLIADSLLGFVNDIAHEAGVPVIQFKGTSACYLWTKLCTLKLVEAGEIPFKEHTWDEWVSQTPRPSNQLSTQDVSNPDFQSFIKEAQMRAAHPIILNTFKELEGPVLSNLQPHYARIYPISPLHAHLKYRLGLEETTLSKTSGTLWEADQSCISWLEQKPDKSVVHVSYGSLIKLTRDHFIEFWAVLVKSNNYFLWVVRHNLIIGSDPDSAIPPELEGTKERGCMVGWAPQEQVLAHQAVGGFLTHSRWNSTLESIVAGVPMLCWPSFADQHVNSRYVSEVWNIGLDMKDICNRTVVKKMVNDLMDERRNELETSMATMSHLAMKSIAEGGSSHSNLDLLVADIKAMSKKEAHFSLPTEMVKGGN